MRQYHAGKQGMRSPNIVHQIWLQGWDERPTKFNDNIRRLRNMNEEFVFMTWDETTISREAMRISPGCWDLFRSLPYLISKVDFGRYILLYNYGGISIDLDMKPLKPIRETPGLDDHDFIVSGGAFPFGDVGLVNNAVFIVTPKHPLLLALIESIIAQKADPTHYPTQELYVMNTTGPLAVSQFIHKHPTEIHVLNNQYFEPCISTDPLCSVDPTKSIMDHRHEQSWTSDLYRSIQSILFVFAHYWWIVVFVIMIVSSNGLKEAGRYINNGKSSNNRSICPS
jgi:mannosyltransferase OCH1-like enzyme